MSASQESQGLLKGVRIIECSLLGPAGITTNLADLGADVIKVEPPQGDYGRRMTWPMINGTSLLHLHVNRGKRSIVLDLRLEEARRVFLDLVKRADAVVEAMRPGALARRGLSYETLREVNPRIVFCTISGYGATGPYRDLPSHGIAYDAWAGVITPEVDEEGFAGIPLHTSIGINVGPLYGAIGILAAVIRARESGEGAQLEVAQSDAAAAVDWLRIETTRAYERPEDEVTGNPTDGGERREPGIEGMRGGVRYQIYRSRDGHVLFMASEREFWHNFCRGVDRMDLFEAQPGEQYGDHARGNRALQAELQSIFETRTTAEWVEFGNRENTPIAPVHSPASVVEDPQFRHRMPWIPASRLEADQLPTPIKVADADQPLPTRAPTVGEHTAEVLRTVLGWDDEQIAAFASSGATEVRDGGT
jgi:crotonobetainyl-CoA:carnitine CoA-transferase CaiB-like acyl-CoA transferase